MKEVNWFINRTTILEQIGDYLKLVEHWKHLDHYVNAATYRNKADALISLLEKTTAVLLAASTRSVNNREQIHL